MNIARTTYESVRRWTTIGLEGHLEQVLLNRTGLRCRCKATLVGTSISLHGHLQQFCPIIPCTAITGDISLDRSSVDDYLAVTRY